MSKTLTAIIVLVVVVGGYLMFKNKTEAPVDTGGAAGTVEQGSGANVGADDVPVDGTGSGSGANVDVGVTAAVGTVKSFTVEGGMFYFAPKTMTVNKGDTVRITFVNKEGMHDWRLDEFNAKTNVIGAGKTETIEFVAGKSGTFEYYCSVGTHRQMGMKGTLTVK